MHAELPMRLPPLIAAILVFLRIPGANLHAQEAAYRIQAVSLEQGVPHNFIQCLLQDRQGFLWFGSALGLMRYDGYNYVTYRHDPGNPYSLSNDDIMALCEDEAGNLWIGTYGGGLNKFDPVAGNFTRYLRNPADSSSLAHNVVLSLYIDPASPQVLWVGTEGGLCQFDQTTHRFVRYQHDPADPGSLSHNIVRALYADKDGTLWIGTPGGLCRLYLAQLGELRRSDLGRRDLGDVALHDHLNHPPALVA